MGQPQEARQVGHMPREGILLACRMLGKATQALWDDSTAV